MKRFLIGCLEQVFLLGILIGSLFIVFGDRITAEVARGAAKTTLITKASDGELKEEKEKANYDWNQVSSANVVDALSAKFTNAQAKPIALVTQPEAKIASTVVAGLDKYQLNLSVGTIDPNQELGKGNYVLVGHHVPKSDWALFSGVYYYGEIGQKVYLTDLNKVYQYEIKDVQLVDETAVEILDTNKWQTSENNHKPGVPMLTLLSCDITGKKRITEFADLEKVYDFNKDLLPKEAVDGFEKAGEFSWTS